MCDRERYPVTKGNILSKFKITNHINIANVDMLYTCFKEQPLITSTVTEYVGSSSFKRKLYKKYSQQSKY